jgi:hypothetical protein
MFKISKFSKISKISKKFKMFNENTNVKHQSQKEQYKNQSSENTCKMVFMLFGCMTFYVISTIILLYLLMI